jgi:ABC-2 type transport system permease protein
MSYLHDVAANLVRWWWRLRREPVTLAVDVAQPVLWLVLFGHLFQHASLGLGAGVGYLTFMTPGVIVMTMFNVALAGGLEIVIDRENGMLRRLMVAPLHRSSMLVGRFLFAVLLGLAQVAVLLVVGALMGVGLGLSAGAVLLAALADVLIGSGIGILSLVLAFRLKGHGPFYAILGFVTLPLTFLSTAFAPLTTMAGWLRWLASWNPLTYAIDAVRSVLIAHASFGAVAGLLAYLLVFDLLCLAFGVRVFRRALS